MAKNYCPIDGEFIVRTVRPGMGHTHFEVLAINKGFEQETQIASFLAEKKSEVKDAREQAKDLAAWLNASLLEMQE